MNDEPNLKFIDGSLDKMIASCLGPTVTVTPGMTIVYNPWLATREEEVQAMKDAQQGGGAK